ncbi:MAG: DUF5916 domain-containing protein [Candidatus Halalkalibacterium sp. M3_1C_030]
MLLVVSILMLPFGLFAQNVPEHSATQLNGNIDIDGNLSESLWNQVDPISGFYQFEPDEGSPSSQRTEVWVLYGDGNVYIGALLYDDDPFAIERALGRRDDYNRADWFLVSIDSYFNRRTSYTFGVNAAGVQFDAFRTGGGGGGPGPRGMDTSWDAIWESAVNVNSEGWVVEMRIPYSMLRFPDSDDQTWGIHFTRRIPRLGEVSEWPLVPRAERSNLMAGFGRLTEIRNVEPRPNIQLRPYTVGGLSSRESIENPGDAVVETNLDIGGDVKVGLGSNITLDATINPDFGQVESDPAVLNLTAFETFFDEKRPFFIEGGDIFDFRVGRGSLLYTRRIGAKAPIIGAAKLSGRTEKGTSFGVMGATSGNQFEPSQNYGVVRVSQQVGTVSEVGAILTGYDAPSRDGVGRIQSTSGGVDFDIRFLDNRYGLEGVSAVTHRSWTAPGKRSNTGIAGEVELRKRQGVFDGSTGLLLVGDTFNPNDIGQFRDNNFISSVTRFGYQINNGRSFGLIRRANINMFSTQQFSYKNGLNRGLDLNIRSNWMFMDFQEVELGISTERPFGGYDLFETRGLGPWARPASYQIQGEFNTDQRRLWSVQPEASYTWHEDGGRGYSLGFLGDWNIGTRVSINANLEGEWEQGVTAWASNESFRRDGTEWQIGQRSVSPVQLEGDEYNILENPGRLNTIFTNISPYAGNTWYVPVFGKRDTRSLDFTLRSDITLTTKLSVQLYSQFFLARGRYENFQIQQNRDDLAAYSSYPKQSEFTLSNLQSNIVFLWEYLPGSNIYLVWTHGRQLRQNLNPLSPHGPSTYQRSIGNRIQDTFDIFPENALLFKVEYTFLY